MQHLDNLNMATEEGSPLFENVTTSMLNLTNITNVTSDNGNLTNRVQAVVYFPWSNPSNIMTKEMSDEVAFVLQCFVFPAITIFGVTGNILSLVVMLQKKLRDSTTSIVLIALAFSDTFFLVTNMLRKSTGIIKIFDPALSNVFNAVNFGWIFYLKTAFSRVSTFLVVVISIERLIAVAKPLQVHALVTKTRMRITVIACYVIVFGCLAVLPVQYTHTYFGDTPYISQTDFALNNVDALKIYNEYFLPIVFRYIPVLVVLFVNIAIIAILGQSRQFQKNVSQVDSKRQEEQRKITRLLLSVSIIFLICLVPGDILLLVSTTVDGFQFFGTYHNLFLALSDISLLFEMVNSSINFIIYMVFNRNFYKTYVSLFRGCARIIASRDSTSSSSARRNKDTCRSGITDRKIEEFIGPESSSGYVGSDNPAKEAHEESEATGEHNSHDNLAYAEVQ